MTIDPIATSIDPIAVVSIRDLMTEVELAVPEGGAWCSVAKASTLVSIILALRPKIVVELGVWTGGSAIPMAIALRHLGVGVLIAVDAWSAPDSIQGQGVVDSKWWGETVGPEGHEQAFQMFKSRLEKHHVSAVRCLVVRQRTDEAAVPPSIDVLHHDANHGPQAVLDIVRWAPAVRVGGLLILDDLDWAGDHVRRARAHAITLGFVELYTTHLQDPQYRPYCVLQRVRL